MRLFLKPFCHLLKNLSFSRKYIILSASVFSKILPPALSECQSEDYGTGLVHQPKPEGRRLTSALPNEIKYSPLNFSEEFYVPDNVPITTTPAPL